MYYPRVSSFAIEQICSSKIKNWSVLPGEFVPVSLVPSDSYAVGKLGILGIVGMRSSVSPRCRYSALCFALHCSLMMLALPHNTHSTHTPQHPHLLRKKSQPFNYY